MKYTNIYDVKTGSLVLLFCSETTWIPLQVNDYIKTEDGFTGRIVQKVFKIESDTMELQARMDEE